MTVSQIADILNATLQDGQLELKESTIASLPLANLFTLLESEGIVFNQAEIIAESDRVTLTGLASLLNATDVLLKAVFQDSNGSINFDLSANHLPICRIPGAAWLDLREGQIALKVIEGDVAGSISGSVRVGDSEISTALLVGKVEGECVLQWTIAQLDLSAIAATFLNGASMPPDLPNLAFKDIETTIQPKSRSFSFQASSAQALSFPASGNGFNITETSLAMSRKDNQIECAIAIHGHNSLLIAEEFALNEVQLELKLAGQEWSISGAVEAELFAQSLTLAAKYHQTQDEKSLKLFAAATPAIKIIDLNDIGHFSLSQIALELSKKRTTEPSDAQSAWSLSASGAIQITDVLDFEGTLTLFKQTDKSAGLMFEPDLAGVRLQLPPKSSMDLDFGGVSIVRQPSLNSTTTEFAFESAVALAFKGFHPTVHKYLPETIQTTFKADRHRVTLTADRVLQPFDFVIPPIEIDADTKIDLGVASLDVSDLIIRLGQEIELGAQLGVGLPANLNKLFGVKDDGTALVEFFKTFDPNDRDNTVVKTELSIGTAGIKIMPTSSILRAVQLVEENGETFWYCKLGDNGEFGEVKFKVPVFKYDLTRSSFMASGGFETIKPLALPMTSVKQLLKACKLQGAADALPNSLPLKEIKIVDDQGNFKVDELIAELGAIGANLPADSLTVIGDHLDELPDSFKQYLNIEIPQSFDFDLAVTPEGSVRFDARVKEGDPPIKLMSPALLGVLPVLNCVQLRSISFGELAGGSLFLLQVDATLDQFDLVTLASTLLMPKIENSPLPLSRSLHRRLILDKLFMVIVYQTVIPIPIPLFYDEIGIEYLGLEGVELGAHAQFPMPTFDLAEAGKLLSNFKQFFSDRTFLLDPNSAPKNLNLTFSLNKNFLELPKYLSPTGTLLGDNKGGPEINACASLAKLMNGMKTLSVNELIQAMPLTNRVGNTAISFGAMSGSLGWLVTTPDEFRQIAIQPAVKQIAYSQLGLAPSVQADSVLSVLPTAATPNEQGLVVLLKGKCAVKNLASFETVFGLAASGLTGFATGFQMVGTVADTIELGLAGRVAIQPKNTNAFRLEGHSYLKIADQTVFSGDVQMSDRRFECQGLLNLFGLGGSVAMSIDLDQGAEIRGALNPIDLGVFKLNQASLVVKIQPNQAPILNAHGSVELLGISNQTDITVSEQGFSFSTSGKLFNVFSGTIAARGTRLNNADQTLSSQQSANVTAARNKVAQLQAQVDALQNRITQLQGNLTSIGQVTQLQVQLASLSQQLQIEKSVLSAALDVAQKINQASFRVSVTMQTDLLQFIKTEATQVIKQGADKAQADITVAQTRVDDAQREVNRLQQTVDQQRAIVRGERATAQQKFDSAQADFNAKQAKVNELNNGIRSRQQEIDLLTPGEVCKTVFGKRFCVPGVPSPANFARITKLGIEIAGLETARGTATGALTIAQGVLDVTKQGLNATPIDADPRVFGPLGLLKTATGVLTASQETLALTKQGVGAAASASDYIARFGLANLLQINSASFDADLNTASGGRVTLNVNLTCQGKVSNLALGFNLKDPQLALNDAQALGRQLLSA